MTTRKKEEEEEEEEEEDKEDDELADSIQEELKGSKSGEDDIELETGMNAFSEVGVGCTDFPCIFSAEICLKAFIHFMTEGFHFIHLTHK